MALQELQLPCTMSYGSNFGVFQSGGGKLIRSSSNHILLFDMLCVREYDEVLTIRKNADVLT